MKDQKKEEGMGVYNKRMLSNLNPISKFKKAPAQVSIEDVEESDDDDCSPLDELSDDSSSSEEGKAHEVEDHEADEKKKKSSPFPVGGSPGNYHPSKLKQKIRQQFSSFKLQGSLQTKAQSARLSGLVKRVDFGYEEKYREG
mmetsp:Transcript_24690/g.38419  ORF Transcript_24690/g.38419 Transcript_24690/m.38419 type:complete len:142 (+) Transcript_24690:152-577(+)|eukprot:CAMPEP_0170480868 /NCGR_PEP_ID=MMETSP0208-20121228/1536_1 /TAXON_ID=197538 /ORGANISM="Strombidium inclinatum, Strain S3" /LENGTH=141 /DNA_ID=CAMNT_0010753475 /DNA_START=153 /DNA_END=578 /DNA_ORIENTATION=+